MYPREIQGVGGRGVPDRLPLLAFEQAGDIGGRILAGIDHSPDNRPDHFAAEAGGGNGDGVPVGGRVGGGGGNGTEHRGRGGADRRGELAERTEVMGADEGGQGAVDAPEIQGRGYVHAVIPQMRQDRSGVEAVVVGTEAGMVAGVKISRNLGAGGYVYVIWQQGVECIAEPVCGDAGVGGSKVGILPDGMDAGVGAAGAGQFYRRTVELLQCIGQDAGNSTGGRGVCRIRARRRGNPCGIGSGIGPGGR